MATGNAQDDALAGAYLAAMAACDAQALAELLAPDAFVRALIPNGLRERAGAAAVADLLISWYVDASEITPMQTAVSHVGPRLAIRYLFRVVEEGVPKDVEQVAYAWVEGDRITQLHVLCSGFHPVAAPARRHEFDAGDLGCGDGLPQEFRRRIQAIEVGDLLEVTAADPAAKADLPPLARLMGHVVISDENLPDGRVRVVVERRR